MFFDNGCGCGNKIIIKNGCCRERCGGGCGCDRRRDCGRRRGCNICDIFRKCCGRGRRCGGWDDCNDCGRGWDCNCNW